MPIRSCRSFCVATMLALGCGHAALAQDKPLYRVTQAIDLGAPDRWDYVHFDGPAQRVYVAHGDGVSVVDLASRQVVAKVTGISGGTHGTATVGAIGKGYTDDGEAGTIKVFDLKTLVVEKTLTGEVDADGMVFDPFSQRVFVINGDSETVTAVDTAHGDKITTIRVGGKLEAGIADAAGALYVLGAARREVIRLDTVALTVTSRWPVAACESPHGIALDSFHHRLFVTCVNARLVVLNTDSGQQVADLPIGRGTDAAAFDPVRGRIFSSNGRDGTLSVIAEDTPDSFHVLATIATAISGRTMDIDPLTGTLYIAAGELDAAATGTGRQRIKPGSLRLLVVSPQP